MHQLYQMHLDQFCFFQKKLPLISFVEIKEYHTQNNYIHVA